LVISFKSPIFFAWHIGKDLVVNGISIYFEIKNAIQYYDAGDYLKFGECIGAALAMTFIGNA
jgi:hypothetical protein